MRSFTPLCPPASSLYYQVQGCLQDIFSTLITFASSEESVGEFRSDISGLPRFAAVSPPGRASGSALRTLWSQPQTERVFATDLSVDSTSPQPSGSLRVLFRPQILQGSHKFYAPVLLRLLSRKCAQSPCPISTLLLKNSGAGQLPRSLGSTIVRWSKSSSIRAVAADCIDRNRERCTSTRYSPVIRKKS